MGLAPGAPVASAIPELARQRFFVEFKEGETTVVCYRELLRKAAMENKAAAPAASESSLNSAKPVESTHEGKQARPDNGAQRFSNLIERIEGLYRGTDDSEEEQSQDLVDEHYDSDDSFIDDKELDDYFAVEKEVKLKYSGFYIHKGPFEIIPEADEPFSIDYEAVADERNCADVRQQTQAASGRTPRKRKPKNQASVAAGAPKRRKPTNAAAEPGANNSQQKKGKSQNVKKPPQAVVACAEPRTKDAKQPSKAVTALKKQKTVAAVADKKTTRDAVDEVVVTYKRKPAKGRVAQLDAEGECEGVPAPKGGERRNVETKKKLA